MVNEMDDFKYTLKIDDLKEYYLTAMQNDSEIIKFHWRLRLFIPVGIFLFLAFTARKVWTWMIGIALVILWLVLADKVLFEKYKNTLLKKYLDPSKMNLTEMHIHLTEKSLYVNGKEQIVYDYAIFESMIVIILQNKTNILVPIGIFEDTQKLETFMNKIRKLSPLYNDQISEESNGKNIQL